MWRLPDAQTSFFNCTTFLRGAMTQETQSRAGRTGPGCRPRVRGSALLLDGSPLLSWGRVEVGGILADGVGLSLWILGKIHKRKLENNRVTGFSYYQVSTIGRGKKALPSRSFTLEGAFEHQREGRTQSQKQGWSRSHTCMHAPPTSAPSSFLSPPHLGT